MLASLKMLQAGFIVEDQDYREMWYTVYSFGVDPARYLPEPLIGAARIRSPQVLALDPIVSTQISSLAAAVPVAC